jgi:hypothetical protein
MVVWCCCDRHHNVEQHCNTGAREAQWAAEQQQGDVDRGVKARGTCSGKTLGSAVGCREMQRQRCTGRDVTTDM